jgi:hypothetical protein
MILNAAKFLNMKDFKITSDWIDRYNDDELEEPERIFFLQQMADNPILRTEVHIDSRLNSFFNDEDLMDLMKKIRAVTAKPGHTATLIPSMLIAATVMCLLIFGAVVYFIEKKPVLFSGFIQHQTVSPETKHDRNSKSGDNLVEQRPETDKPVVNSNGISQSWLLSENYKPMAEFELLVGSVTRSTQIKLMTPASKIKIRAGIPVRFSWISQNNQCNVTLVIVNNLGNVIFESQLLHYNEYTLQTKGMPGGLYYWKIVQDDELVIMGKLTLN